MKFFLTLIPFLIICTNSFGQVGELIWEDNFNEGSLDLSKWTIETGTGINGDWGTGQLDRATARPENLSFAENITDAEDGCLVISIQKEFYIDRNYTSGRIRTAGKASWGPGHRIVTRAFPRDVRYKGQGFAFWMMPDELPAGWDYIMWPQGGELDIMEYVGSIPFNNLGSVHYAWFWENNQWQEWNHGHSGAYYNYKDQEVPTPSEPGYGAWPPTIGDPNAGSTGFHTYGIDWHANRIEFFVDDNVYHIHYLNDGGFFQQDGQDGFSITEIDNKRLGVSEYSNHFDEWYPFEHKMYAILSAGVGGGQHTYGGSIVDEAEFPCSVFIDWVRVYELESQAATDENLNAPNFRIYPNPGQDILNIDINNSENYVLRIRNSDGKTLIRTEVKKSSSIDISNLKTGIYATSLSTDEITITKKIIIQ